MIYSTLITPSELSTQLDNPNWVIIDCRFDLTDTEKGRTAYLENHIPTAIYAHLDDDLSGPIIKGKSSRHPLPEIEILTQTLSTWGIDETIQVIAYDAKGGAIASRLWWMLRWLGHEAVAVLDGGWPRWIDEGRAIQTGEESVTTRQFTPKHQPNLCLTSADVRANYTNPGFQLFDSRAAPRYRGDVEPLDPIAGHIPGAMSAPFADNLQDGRFLPISTLQQRFTTLFGNIPAEEIVFYCGSGVTACHNILAVAHAGLGLPRLYAGSWSEWITQPSPPVELG